MSDDSSGVRRFGLHARPDLEEARAATERARRYLEAAGAQALGLDQVLAGQRVEALLSFGGDGTLLHTARLMAPLGIPVLGINFGRVGYLCEVSEERLEDALDRLLARNYSLDQRSMVRGRVFRGADETWWSDALNEILIGGTNRTLTLDVTIDGHFFGTIRGDGIIVATRTGSTAYAFSAGGSILLLEAMVLVASNALFASSIRSLVLPLGSTVRICNRTRVARPYVIADGQHDHTIDEDQHVDISRSPLSASLVNLGLISPVEKLGQGFYEQLKAGIRPRTETPRDPGTARPPCREGGKAPAPEGASDSLRQAPGPGQEGGRPTR